MRHGAYSAVQQGERRKSGPRHADNVSWAVGKFFLVSFLIYSTNRFFTRRLCDITHIEPYNREIKKGGFKTRRRRVLGYR